MNIQFKDIDLSGVCLCVYIFVLNKKLENLILKNILIIQYLRFCIILVDGNWKRF